MALGFLAITGLVTIGFQLFFFFIAATLKIDKVTDFSGTFNFVVLAILTLLLKATFYTRQVVLTAFVIVWGLRLGIFLLMRILAWGEDNRFDDTRNNLPKLAAFWFFQALWVWTVSLPVTVVNATSEDVGLEVRDYVGWVMFVVGMIIEAVADQTKLNYKKDPKNKGKWTDAGVWSWSRHPNYFGEILLWWGIFVASTPVLAGKEWGVVASPLMISFLILFLSGMPILETSADKRHGNKPDYIKYKKEASPLIPLPPAVYGSLPQVAKVLLLELPFYSKNLSAGEGQLRTGPEDA